MAVVGLGQQFPAGILYCDEGLGLGAGVSGHPADSLVRGLVYALVRDGDNFAVYGIRSRNVPQLLPE